MVRRENGPPDGRFGVTATRITANPTDLISPLVVGKNGGGVGPLSGVLPFAAPVHPCTMAALGRPALCGTCTSLCNGISPAPDTDLIRTPSINKKGHPLGDLSYWWRRRESNPSPQVIRLWLYMLIRSISLIEGYPIGRENQQRAWLSFNESTPGVLHRDPV